ncbi:MAG: 50S ribosomal protein L31 [Candidatus Midichloria mitochondrii]|uniref:50S ribosomal protein L31 n=1 Tax=Midichloria mitochondrii (strain IricVA) TaxID=696127 RepID=F7XVZ2_MIDMI|nr:50S ribosomal protein L31 [Candidatus Midichloria mitochondrii]AEI88841.1 ribosomal protein L31 [Candidatus Midichloria mitochondrii IricVA]MDJ1256543.1 50S ribosomal protein L31 [Candidatus Midichloria mitochondrii]MDJ1288258.1 50S ribosomal protein L31 [Candidatus Midichloria mitochondrii]MDJ1299095.1 50S ribosomal protein L31 [Candidatus Midichloria mitochondrii]MDJ1313263.1 50S ribosomal protein L31 [Candidatus Midichloria mitochondrii]
MATKKATAVKESPKEQTIVANAENMNAAAAKKIKRGTMHHNYREVEVTQTDGATFMVRSTYKNTSLRLDIDPKTHPAWTKEAGYVNTKNSEVAKFNSKFAGLSFGIRK